MASLQAAADSIRTAVSSTSTCTTGTTIILSELLLPKANLENKHPAPNAKQKTRPAAVSRSKAKSIKPSTTSRVTKAELVDKDNKGQHVDGHQLSAKERSILATEVINATLKSLSEAIKAPPTAQLRRQASSKDVVKASARRTLRRSTSLPQSPLQPRSLNRVSSSPGLPSRPSSSSSSTSIAPSPGHRPTAECARIAFGCLRSLQAAKIPGVNLPPLQLENGMSVLIGRLISLGLDDLATKELRILKKRLELDDPQQKTPTCKSTAAPTPQHLAQLLDFGETEYKGAKLGLVISTQLHILRLMASSSKNHAQDAVAILNPSHPSSPTKMLLSFSRDPKSKEKSARQLQTLSDVLLSLCPSVSPSDDALALEPRLSVTPDVAFQLQTFALHNRILWWKLAGHKADPAKDLFDPFLRCLSTLTRRNRGGADTYKVTSAAFLDLQRLSSGCCDTSEEGLWPILTGIYRLMSSMAQESNLLEDAIHWTLELQGNSDCVNSDAKQSFIVARLAALTLRRPVRDSKDEELLLTLLDSLERPFKGDSSEIEDLLTEVSYTRRGAIAILARSRPSSSPESKLTEGMRQMCESLVFICPRLCLRYLGKSLDETSSTKELVRYEQRRQFIAKSALHSIDSVSFLVKTLLNEGGITWELLDSKLLDCLSLLDQVDKASADTTPDDSELSKSYYVRLSNIYYTHYLNERRNPEPPKDSQKLRILRRSVDCVKAKSQTEKNAAYFLTKLERMAEICRTAGRYDELFQILESLRDEMISTGVLSRVAAAVASQPLQAAWNIDDQSSMLARTIHALLKTQVKYLNATTYGSLSQISWSHDERGAVLEYQLQFLSGQSKKPAVYELQAIIFRSLLSLYDRKSYPIRRLRVLIRLMSLDLEPREEFMDSIQGEVTVEAIEACVVEGTEDESLRNYLAHFQTLAISTMELQQDQPRLNVLTKNLSAWSSIQKTCESLEALECQVEDVVGFMDHLQSISEYLQMKGLDTLRVAVLRLIADLNEILLQDKSSPDGVILSLTALGSQWLQLGYSGKAGLALDRAHLYSHRNGVSQLAMLQLQLAYSTYLATIGNFEKCEEQLLRAQCFYSQSREASSGAKPALTVEEKATSNRLLSDAYLIYSIVSVERGAAHTALKYARQSVRLLRRAWAYIEDQSRHRSAPSDGLPELEIENLSTSLSKLNMSTTTICADADRQDTSNGPCFWALIAPLFRSLNHLSGVYAHHGMFQETVYYAEQAYKFSKVVGSEAHQAMAAALMGNALLKVGTLDKGAELLMESKQLSSSLEKSRDKAILSYYLGRMYGRLGDPDAEITAYGTAEDILESLSQSDYIGTMEAIPSPTEIIEQSMAQLALLKPKAPVKRKAPSRSKAAAKTSKTVARAKSPEEPTKSISEECTQLLSFKATILRQKARTLMFMKQCNESLLLVEQTAPFVTTQGEAVDQALAMAKQLLFQSMEQMTADPVYSVLQDSTISFPSVVGLCKSDKTTDRLSVTRTSPPRKLPATKRGRDQLRSKSPAPDGFFEKLRQAEEHLLEAYSTAVNVAPVALIHNISALLNSVSMLLCASGQSKGKSIAHPGFASCNIEIARTLALRREYKAIHSDSSSSSKLDDSCWPKTTLADPRRSSSGIPHDMSRFQRDYIDIIPKTWTAISISLSDSRNELSVTKLQAGHSPFVLRLPLARHNSMDVDEEVFDFEQGNSELMDIIERANESAHDARGTSGREAKIAWWEEREALDRRLGYLLENIEKVWLGGFTGIFSQHTRRPELLARFQKSFHNILDRHLPSRQKSGKRNATPPRINLDSRILDLFIGLGDASEEDCDFSEPLTDLLYFVVDVLQFHGELNAYAEIDFDSIVIETLDALRCYYEAVHTSSQPDDQKHTVLILDKALHAFPWESLPCMDGQAVSRLPSLGCLRDRIIQQQYDTPDDAAEGCYIRPENGSYILNPGGDLKNTQVAFEKDLQKLKNWDGIVKREPTEDEFKESLATKELFLYFGHGSGAQYIRAREIRKLEKCAVSFLMGCSSGALTEAGEFEPYGPTINYMHAGCPALVGTLWDVTDKDIDRFAASTLEHWGLFEGSEKRGKGKGRKKAPTAPTMEERTSVVEAVAKGRKACNLRYLNAAAVCVYGVPVYLR